MKAIVVLLLCSLAANVALWTTFSARPALAPPALQRFFEPATVRAKREAVEKARADTAAAREEAGRAARIASEKQVWPRLQSTDLKELTARLKAAGFPPDIVRAIIAAEIDAQIAPRRRELFARLYDTGEFWKSDPMGGYNPKIYEEVSALFRERSKLLRSIVGEQEGVSADVTAGQRARFGNLSQTKIDLLQQIESDYNEMTNQVRMAMRNVTLPEDREQLALLQREKKADIAAILSPEELADYEMRTSRITQRLRPAFTIMDAGEAEFRAIYGVMEKYADTLYPNSPVPITTYADMQKRTQVQNEAQEQLRQALGTARYEDFKRANDRDYQQLYRLALRDNVPMAAANQAYAIRETVAADSTRIANDTAMSVQDKQAALKTLGQTARAQLNNLLGPTAGPAYSGSASWLRYVEGGGAVTFGPDGSPRYRSVGPINRPRG